MSLAAQVLKVDLMLAALTRGKRARYMRQVVLARGKLGRCGSNSVVECHLAKVDVEGSNPFSRSIDRGGLH
jgi:hypothetical protein